MKRKYEEAKVNGVVRKVEWKKENGAPVRTAFIPEERKKLRTFFNLESHTAATVEISTADDRVIRGSEKSLTFKELSKQDENIVRKAAFHNFMLH